MIFHESMETGGNNNILEGCLRKLGYPQTSAYVFDN